MSIWQPDIGPIGKLRDTYSSLPTPVKVGINVLPQTRALKIGRTLLHGLETVSVFIDSFQSLQNLNPELSNPEFRDPGQNKITLTPGQTLNKFINQDGMKVDELWWKKKKKGLTLSIRA